VTEVRIGCSGWNYKDWREVVYPKGLPARRWLEHYATLFDTVEVNATFYRLPTRKTVAGWAYGRGRGGNYSRRQLEEWRNRIVQWRRRIDVYAYFNNDWEGFAVVNGLFLRRALGA